MTCSTRLTSTPKTVSSAVDRLTTLAKDKLPWPALPVQKIAEIAEKAPDIHGFLIEISSARRSIHSPIEKSNREVR
jgi:hypothetical protein